jgi:N-acyl-D-amino-acid deacylase
MFDLVIRRGLVADGSGLPAFRADVAVQDGRIVHIGRADAQAARTIDATDRVVAPGFIDIHTHFDAQLSWDPVATPMLEHGVTTIVTGNCSLSLAPLRVDQRPRLSRMFGQIEQLPQPLFDVGVDWAWESFAEWIACREPRVGLNVAPLVGHSALRMFVMGDDAHDRPATDPEVRAMQAELRDALAAGAAGLSVSCVDIDELGQPVPSRLADRDEISRLAECLGDAGGVLQIVPEYWDSELVRRRIDELAELSRRQGIATTFAPLIDQTPGLVDDVLVHLDAVRATGARVHAQVQPRGIDVNFRLCEWNFALYRCSGWSRVLRMTDRDEQLATYGDPETRRRLVATAYPDDDPDRRAQLDTAYVSAVDDPSLGDLVGRTLAAIAAERGTNPAEAMLDVAMADRLETRFTRPPSSNRDLPTLVRMLRHPSALIGASDAGAHVRGFSTYGDTSWVLGELVRRRGVFTLEEAVRRITSDLAHAWNLPGRGRLATGQVADLVVFDPVTIDRSTEVDLADLPTGCRRYVRGSVGIDATIVNGHVAWSASGGYSSSLAGAIASRRPAATTPV